ncbi:uncharacterized protein A4U43_UnF10300 [Asparagus officinalis]|uniref:Uncharacterized protein n=1 Tax=Asparagus officinalis TaxID=4686 RepID=A0A1R3L5I5_ASPOF|nr:UDP-glucose flavonoid 3-O-glucosyltransferase 7-like [Asparagus officinalis]ONK54868.1 uncharacterized protein A4U43_UnF10300 [Asparagus officinalis]
MVRGWAPQTAILAHKAVGGFMTQCGWNAVLESVATAGVPLLTWPLVFEQYMNERLVVEGVGREGLEFVARRRSTMDKERVVVPAEVIEKVVFRFMGGEGGAVRSRVKELAKMACCAVAKGGGSRNDFDCLIGELMATKELQMKKEHEHAN